MPLFEIKRSLIRDSVWWSVIQPETARGEKSFFTYLVSAVLDPGPEPEAVLFGELAVDGVEPWCDLGVKTANPSL